MGNNYRCYCRCYRTNYVYGNYGQNFGMNVNPYYGNYGMNFNPYFGLGLGGLGGLWPFFL